MDTPSSIPGGPHDADSAGRFRIAGHAPTGVELTNAMIHLYRGEMGRSNIWRTRLDATTNWAVITTGAALTFAFGGSADGASHVVLLVISVLVLLFLFIEARRYRYHELWTHRVRLMETHFFANLLRSPAGGGSSGWEDRLVDSLCAPRFPISLMEALGRRYRRTYALLFLILGGSWLLKVATHAPASGFSGLLQASVVGPIPGWLVLGFWFLFNAGLIALGVFTVGLRQTGAEVFGTSPRARLKLLAWLRAATRDALEIDLAALKPSFGGGKHLAWIISDQPEAIGKALLKDLDRGVTRIRAEGMYSGKEHSLLLSVVHSRQVERLRELVHDCDPLAFVVILAARDVRGEGFRPLEA